MAIGNVPDPATLNATVSNLALQLRRDMQSIKNFEQWFFGLTLAQVGTLFALNATDAATMQTMVSYLNNVASVYYGTIQQGGTGGTGAILFNFDNGLSQLWGGQ